MDYDKLISERDKLVIKHRNLNRSLNFADNLNINEALRKFEKQIKKIEKRYAELHEEIEDYYYSLEDSVADEIVKPNPLEIKEFYRYL